jgi:hypothetical protein
MAKNPTQSVLTLNLSPEQKQMILNATGKMMDTFNVMGPDGMANAKPLGAKPIAVQGPQGLQIASGIPTPLATSSAAAPQGSRYVRGPNGPQLVSETHALSPKLGPMSKAPAIMSASAPKPAMMAPGMVRGPQGPQTLPTQRAPGSQIVRGPQGPQIM